MKELLLDVVSVYQVIRKHYCYRVHQPPTLKKNITMVAPFVWSSGMAIVLIANILRQPLCNGLVEGADKGFIYFLYIGPAFALFLAIALFAPSPSILPPSPLHPSLPDTLVAIATALFLAVAAARLPTLSPSPSPSHPHPPRRSPPSLPPQLLPPPSPLLSLAPHPCCHRHRSCHHHHCHCHPSPPSAPLQLPSLSPLPSLARHPCRHCAASDGGGEDHTNPVRDPTSAATVGATIIVTAFATRETGREGPVQWRAGFQRPADSLRHPYLHTRPATVL
jgi:hypothetical protein